MSETGKYCAASSVVLCGSSGKAGTIHPTRRVAARSRFPTAGAVIAVFPAAGAVVAVFPAAGAVVAVFPAAGAVVAVFSAGAAVVAVGGTTTVDVAAVLSQATNTMATSNRRV